MVVQGLLALRSPTRINSRKKEGLLAAQGRVDEAIEHFQEVLSLTPTCREAQAHLTRLRSG